MSEGAGLYQIIEDQHHDVVYKAVDPEDEVEMEIPEPAVEMYLIGDE